MSTVSILDVKYEPSVGGHVDNIKRNSRGIQVHAAILSASIT